jgi:hypothetical protein
MSSKRRNRGIVTDDILGDLTNNEVENGSSDIAFVGGDSASDIADIGYGSAVGHKDPFSQMTSREKITYKPIDSIHPNRMQPRRTFPTTIRQYFSTSSHDAMAYFFDHWLAEVNLERKSDFPLKAYLEGAETQRIESVEKVDEEIEQIGSALKMGTLETAFMQVVELAASIMRHGLTNPISIARVGGDYEIETGERRWLAYHLLNWQYPDGGWDKIPSRQVDDGISIWRQANENNIRADLNAISMARQFALLLMDILRDEKQFQPFDAFDHEQDFYAQVADGVNHRVPRNQGEKLLNAMNLENPVQLRQYRSLLRLPREIWEWADDLNWTEGFIRMEILGKAETDEDKLRLAYKYAKAAGYTVIDDTVYEELLKVSQSKSTSPKPKYTYKHFSKTLGGKVYNYMTKLSGKDREHTIAYLREMLDSLESQ